jgi:hypothetical protein
MFWQQRLGQRVAGMTTQPFWEMVSVIAPPCYTLSIKSITQESLDKSRFFRLKKPDALLGGSIDQSSSLRVAVLGKYYSRRNLHSRSFFIAFQNSGE